MWTPQLNAVLGSVVVTLGVWLVWGALPLYGRVLMGIALAAFLAWRGKTIGEVWAWSTLLLGVTSLAWPIVTMTQLRLASAQPTDEQTDEQMAGILTAVFFGLFSSIFWISFAFGLFRRAYRKEPDPVESGSSRGFGKKKRRQLR